MDKRSVETSGRPHQYLIELMTGGNVILDLDTTSETWRAHRRAMRTLLAPKAVKDFQPIMVAESSQLLLDMMQSPKDYAKHVGRYNYSLVLSIGYGKRCLPFWKDGGEEPALFRGLKAFSKTVNEAPPLDDLPFLKYMPKPWAAWKEAYKHVKALQSGLYFGLMEEVERRLASGDTNGCFFEDVLTKYQAEYQMSREVTAYLSAAILEAGSESTTATGQTLQEIDNLLPDGRAPTMEDINALPYVRAFVREAFRFRPPSPTGIPHCLTETLQYRGYVIPKGTTLTINVWGILHDPEAFDEPDEFRPERFLLSEHGTKPGVDDGDWRSSIPFGSGKRLCPGMNFALTSLTHAVALLAWAFNFAPAIDPVTKQPIPVDVNAYEPGLPSAPKPFSPSVTPRTPEKAHLIKQRYADATLAFAKYETFLNDEERKALAEERQALLD
ncbi:hypothetical protein NP233_g10860 [Leucocoprinus birnbaumii]|uniref:Cytochrome P450 n=1 Tax=Leucocoprinus birnbaumii TaxID=56174 RepID=A0AAD5VJJ9_9AGAR|nr:hypothetical protein NP233_g10860 [Leucocoprinus birnbaumii]